MNITIPGEPAEVGREDEVPFVRLRGVAMFDAAAVFECGQAFRFDPVPGSGHEREYAGVACGKFLSVAQDGDTVTLYGADEHDFSAVWREWLGLNLDYQTACADILSRSDNPALARAVRAGSGIRILRQDRWEALCSFIISQNNNIPRIKGLIRTLSRELGEKIPTEGTGMNTHGACGDEYAFPTPQAVFAAGPERLFALKTGFRAKYLYDAAARIVSGDVDLDAVAAAPTTAAASEMLQTIRGVGPKVAACTLLFGFGRMDAFPVDVWIRRVLSRYFPPDFTADTLGPYAGLAQQYLFYYERSLNPEL